MRVVLNARYQSRLMTGVERYACEVVQRLPLILAKLAPANKAQGMRGHLWEQAVLPLMFRGDVLWSPCNTGPLAVRRQVVTIHDCAFLDHPGHFQSAFARWYRWLLPQLARRVAHIITVSDFSKSRLIERLKISPEKVTVVPNGVDERFCPQSQAQVEQVRAKYQLPQRYVLSVGSLEPRKNLTRLLKAWHTVADKHPDITLVVAGTTNQRAFRGVELDMPLPNVQFIGYVDYDDLPAIYAQAELFAYPSLYEGFGLPVLEAMACGAPVLCSRTTALPEVAGNAAAFVDPNDIASLADGICQLLADPARCAALREAGLRRAQGYSWNATAAETYRVLQAVAVGGAA
jgi:glycosyltransferase involved in cell wall biosynthesis